MKLVVNIPCLNEEYTIPLVIKDIPKQIPGIDKIEIQIVDDGSTDRTVEVAKKLGVDRVIIHKTNQGLGNAFKHGMQVALEVGADIFVNTDADNQYPSRYIPNLVKPIINQETDIVIGNRRPWKVKHFSLLKRVLQRFGNWATRNVLGSDVPDVVSGFRAYNKEAMLKINVTTKFSYVLDTIMQAVQKGLKIKSIDIETNPPIRKSRLFDNIFQHMRKSGANLIRMYYLYEPLKTFTYLSATTFIPGLILLVRWFYYYFNNLGGGKMQSLVIGLMLLVASILLFGLGIIGDSIKTNRTMIEEEIYLLKKKISQKRRMGGKNDSSNTWDKSTAYQNGSRYAGTPKE